MTREEIIFKLTEGGKLFPVMTSFEAAEVVDFIIKNYTKRGSEDQILKLPDNLDEAACVYSENVLCTGEDMFDGLSDAFREGAKWLARQGVVIPGAYISRNRHTKTNILHFNSVCDAVQKMDPGNVIVHVRKTT